MSVVDVERGVVVVVVVGVVGVVEGKVVDDGSI